MFHLKSDEHIVAIVKDLYHDLKYANIIFIVNEKSYKAHAPLVLHHIEALLNLKCDQCNDHEDIVIILSDVEEKDIEEALYEFYVGGNPEKLRALIYPPLLLSNKKQDQVDTEKLEENYSPDIEIVEPSFPSKRSA